MRGLEVLCGPGRAKIHDHKLTSEKKNGSFLVISIIVYVMVVFKLITILIIHDSICHRDHPLVLNYSDPDIWLGY